MALEPERFAALVELALAEDLGPGDLTGHAVIPAGARAQLAMVAREPLVVAGLSVARAVFARTAPGADFEPAAEDGQRVEAGARLARLEGDARGLLAGERTALNFVQQLSGIATLTRAYVDAIAGTGAVLLDTRKTVPGWRALAKYATRLGGARNHRMGLYDAILIKDNHIAVCGGVAEAVRRAKRAGGPAVEVEVDSLAQLDEALAAGAKRILLDNMAPETLRAACARNRGRAELEASGGITLETVRAVAASGVDFISVGRITHSAPAVDIGLDRIGR